MTGVSCDESYLPPEVDFLDLYRGDRYILPFLIEQMQDPDADPNDPDTVWVGVDLSAGTLAAQLRVGDPSGDEWGDGVISGNLADGEFDLTLPTALTETATVGWTYYYDVQHTVGGEDETLVRGAIAFEQDVTHA